ncbi:metallophosphoesterase [Maribellus sp. CM-23]|uniref:metallophosphoesterase family protein n=1 Tax=Maribellus sp. CM-23 TaxID=2781026 RepID=UPI001F20A922|nr:metallophosphoesterase [Maribellus sp. CM-23]MCE4566974.1 metallophosphoesterase [Maribellus sp. CM-23]
MKRKDFIRYSIGGVAMLTLPIGLNAINKGSKHKIRFGVCADVHKDIMHDADERLQAFINKASEKKTDFIIQMGDFCRPYEQNKEFLDIFNNYPGNKYHVIGNHDMDGGFSREQVIEFWNAPQKYYSFNQNDFHFIVLDGNDKNPSPDKAAGYARFIGKEQVEWLKNDLATTDLPCIVFSHQSLENVELGVENQNEIRAILEAANKTAGFEKVVACFSGHHHTDYATSINGIYYIQINSMSYSWLGGDYQTIRYSKEIDEKFPWIKYTVPYADPLFAFIEIDQNKIQIHGVESTFVGPSPEELRFPKPTENSPIVPMISDRKLKI